MSSRLERGISTETHIPAGVSEKTYEFLIEAIKCGAHENLGPITRNLIGIYFGTKATLSDLAPIAGATTRNKVRRLIVSGLEELWQGLPVHLREKYPQEEVIKLKNPHSPETWAKISRALKKKKRTPKTGKRKSEGEENSYGYETERELWMTARDEGLLPNIPQMEIKYRITKEEITLLRNFFEGKGAKEPHEGLLDRFSIAVARLASDL